ncbi:S-methyl-5-thioribose-1-phosphate isomerase [Chloracidobacterium sp. MS 40/45]|uniref:S-methyl-5-thioribose-1-phosphate isomerase n=1 Tax=Chloracidobacterium aggregatum TaxID=2851959 RepID=UPI001B8AAEAB|nr:S-methyl-5-thioribose-1-phosphate isomerase [Chloracidobacterium aggregatum]QUV99292.1 S-methyl-5-thioribose-1-phosphate isomerase [Chloracidobacterium sp. MS 40/45]
MRTVEWTPAGVRVIDQRVLPGTETYHTYATYEEVAEAIRTMVVRGAPAIGVAAAFGIALGVQASVAAGEDLPAAFERICQTLAATRPTAVNLFWAIERMRRRFEHLRAEKTPEARIAEALVAEAQAIHAEDIATCRQIGRHGAELIPDGATILTHCNAGALATAGYGTALGVIRAAVEQGKRIAVYADETRPFLQGARLTTWELMQDGIPVTLICDNMAGHFMKLGRINCVVVGADRIAANGDTANKIGTYMVAVLAQRHRIPFYVAAPVSTLDLTLETGDGIPIEDRAAQEVTHIASVPVAPAGVAVANPAFDVTPHDLITGIITERGVAYPPFTVSLRRLAAGT